MQRRFQRLYNRRQRQRLFENDQVDLGLFGLFALGGLLADIDGLLAVAGEEHLESSLAQVGGGQRAQSVVVVGQQD